MVESRLSRALMVLGAGVGVLSVGVWALEVQVNLPDWIVRVAMIKLAFIAAGGLLAAGALIGRHAKARSISSGNGIPQLGEGEAPPLDQARSNRTPQGVRRESETPL